MNRGSPASRLGADRLIGLAGEALRSNQPKEALELADEACKGDPKSIQAPFLGGLAAMRMGHWSEAAWRMNRVLELDPRSFEALTSLCTIYRETGNLDGAIQTGQIAVSLRPGDPQAMNNLGRAFLNARRCDEADRVFQRLLQTHPQFAPGHFNFGRVAQLQGKDAEAAERFGRAAQLQPTVDNLAALGQALLSLYDLERAESVARRTVLMWPSEPAAHLLLCGVLIETGREAEAQESLRTAQVLDPDHRFALQIAARQLPLGYVENAERNLRRAISLDPNQAQAYELLMFNHKVSESDRSLADQMTALLEEDRWSVTERASLHYALGKAREGLKEFGPAMHNYDAANEAIRGVKLGAAEFDRAGYSSRVNRMITSSPAIEPPMGASVESPIFIVGMMRSGTTLAEQILSSHPGVFAGGERLWWSRNWGRAFRDQTDWIDEEALAKMGHEYASDLGGVPDSKRRATDKLPGNYMFLGLIARSLPAVKIVHVRRNPLDTCISIWTTPNHAPSEGAHRKADIVFVYREYLRLMAHWRSILPPGRFFEVDYEELVSDRESTTRKMLDFCELTWDDACLHPERNPRQVSTLSVWQVRQPVYSSSVNRWKRFEPWLGEFSELTSALA